MNHRTTVRHEAASTPRLTRYLAEPMRFDGGMRRIPCPARIGALADAVTRDLVERGFIAGVVPLESLHTYVDADDQAWTPTGLSRPSGDITRAKVLAPYHVLVAHLARDVFGEDLVFERHPSLRFHFPVPAPLRFRAPDGTLMAHHSDTLVGDPFEQINIWVPLTNARGSAALTVAPPEVSLAVLRAFAAHVGDDFAAFNDGRLGFYDLLMSDDRLRELLLSSCRPAETSLGELLAFDPRMVHGTAENTQGTTRVSIDFRVIPRRAYERLEALGHLAHAIEGKGAQRGGFYDERFASEL